MLDVGVALAYVSTKYGVFHRWTLDMDLTAAAEIRCCFTNTLLDPSLLEGFWFAVVTCCMWALNEAPTLTILHTSAISFFGRWWQIR